MRDLKMHSALGFALVAAVGLVLHAQSIEITPQTILEVHNVITEPVEYRGKSAWRFAMRRHNSATMSHGWC